jgi:Tfp pilus assembly protein PilX
MIDIHQNKKQFDKTAIFLNEDGAVVIVLAILLLIMITILGTSSVDLSNTELGIIRNEQIYQQNFYQAESGAMNASQRIDNLDGVTDYNLLMPGSTLVWMNQQTTTFFETTANWDYDGIAPADNSAQFVDATNMYAANYSGKQGGSSLKSGSQSVNRYTIYGLALNTGGEALIKMGFKKPVKNP